MSFDRQALWSSAEEARRLGRSRKAIAGYERILAVNPDDVSVHAKLAPLLAKRRRFDAALSSFLLAATDYAERGFLDRALGVYLHATKYLPRQSGLWASIADLHMERDRRADAVAALLEGSRSLTGKKHRGQGIDLLRRALEINPLATEVALPLARLLHKEGQRKEAVLLLASLSTQVTKKKRRSVCWTLFRLSPSPKHFWRWVTARG